MRLSLCPPCLLCKVSAEMARECRSKIQQAKWKSQNKKAKTGGGGGGMMATIEQQAETFCTDFEKICGFSSEYYKDKDDCTDDFINKYDAARRKCVKQHLGFAMSNAGIHCPHAAGKGPCSP